MTPRDLRNIHTTRNSCRDTSCMNMALKLPWYFYLLRPPLKNCLFPITPIVKKYTTRVVGKTFFFNLFKLNINFNFKCYLHHNCSINLTQNNKQLYSSAKPLFNVPCSVFWFVNFFLPFDLPMEENLVVLGTQRNR